MKTFFIRFKSLWIAGLLFFSFSFVWFAVTANHQTRETLAEKEVLREADFEETLLPAEPSLTILTQENKDDFFSEYRLERERTRSEQLEIFNEIVNNPNTNAETRTEAQERLLWLTNNLGLENKIEKALLAKGFLEAVVAVESQAIMVIVPSSGLRQDEVAKIADVVIKIADCALEDVVIVPREP